jgi:hypothetical protein
MCLDEVEMRRKKPRDSTRLTQEEDIKHGILLMFVCYILPLHTFCENRCNLVVS